MGWLRFGGALARGAAVGALMMASVPALADQTEELLTLRNTVVSMLEELVADGLVSEEQAQKIVAKAEAEASTEAASRRQQDTVQAGTVRVPYVPQIVKDELKQQVRDEIRQEVVDDVLEQAKADGWGVPGALPAWITDIKWRGDVRVRNASSLYDSGNAEGVYLDFQAVNEAGGVGEAGRYALLNTSENREAVQTRARLGVDLGLGDSWKLGMRLVTGNDTSPVTRNVVQGRYEAPYDAFFDLAYVHFASDYLLFSGGRMPNPFLSSNIVWDDDLTFDGVAFTGVLPFELHSAKQRAYLTLGAFPLEELAVSSRDKYLLAAQLGTQLGFGQMGVSLGLGYYDFWNVEGERNTFESTLEDGTAPRFVQKGNTLFDIRNDLNPATNLYALASDFNLVNAVVVVDSGPLSFAAFERPLHIRFSGDYVANVGFDQGDIERRTGAVVDERTDGYQLELSVGMPDLQHFGDWQVATYFRHLERDAVLDALTDSDLHLGGTDTEGWGFEMGMGLSHKTSMKFTYLTANEIDGPPLGIDVLFLDLNAKF
jgi:Putative porin